VQAVSVDLPWGASGEAAAVVVQPTGEARWSLVGYPEELLRFLGRQPSSLVLLDIPIYGLDKLGNGHFRPVDRALQSAGVPLLPSTGARQEGRELVQRLKEDVGIPVTRVREIYPYAVYKVLDYLRTRECLSALRHRKAKLLLEGDFIVHWPLPYKKRSHRGTRRQGMEALYQLLIHPDLGLTFGPSLPAPDSGESLKRLADVYDAALGGVLGLHFLRGSPWATVKGDTKHGDMALLADPWLNERLDAALARRVASAG
jgi:predicted nuclease with RNAse H fold